MHQEKGLVLVLIKQKQNIWFSLHYNGDNSYLFDNEKEIYKFKVSDENINFPTPF